MGGNAGTQTMTVTVRALATRDLDIYNAGRIIRREVGVGMLNGMIFAVLIGLVAGFWFGNVAISAASSPPRWSSTWWPRHLPAS